MNWIRENVWHIVTLVISVIGIYMALNDRLIVAEQKIYAIEERQEDYETALRDIREDIKDIDKKTDDLVKYLIPHKYQE